MVRLSSRMCVRVALFALALVVLAVPGVQAQQPLKVGFIIPMTGPMASTGKQVDAAVKLYVAQHGDVVAGRKMRCSWDDANAAETTKRYAQERDRSITQNPRGSVSRPWPSAAPVRTAPANGAYDRHAAGASSSPSRPTYAAVLHAAADQGLLAVGREAGIKSVFTASVADHGRVRARDDVHERVQGKRRPDRRRCAGARPEPGLCALHSTRQGLQT